MKHFMVGLFVLAGLPWPGDFAAGENTAGILVVEEITVVRGAVDGKQVAWFNDGRLYAISMNMKLPNAEALKDAFLATLGQQRQYRGELLFRPFTPSAEAPELVEVSIGQRVPKEIVQSLLGELSRRADLKLALSVVSEDGQGLASREVYIGGLAKSGRKAISVAKLQAILDPKLTQDAFLEEIRRYDQPVAGRLAARTWTDRATGRQLEAQFIDFAGGKVQMVRSRDGKTFHVPLESLSDDDQAFVRSQMGRDRAALVNATPSQLLARFTKSKDIFSQDGKLVVAPDQSMQIEDWERNVAKGATSGPILLVTSGYNQIRPDMLERHLGLCRKKTTETIKEIIMVGTGGGGAEPAPLTTHWYGPVGFSFLGDSLTAIFYRPEKPAGDQEALQP